MFGLGTTELIIIMFIILLVFGAKKLPELAQGLGRGIKEFKKASTDIQDELKVDDYEAPKPKSKIENKEETSTDSKENK